MSIVKNEIPCMNRKIQSLPMLYHWGTEGSLLTFWVLVNQTMQGMSFFVWAGFVSVHWNLRGFMIEGNGV